MKSEKVLNGTFFPKPLEKEELDEHLENIRIKGYTLLQDVITREECKMISSKLDKLEELQEKEFGIDRLKNLGELGIIRVPIEKDDYFQNLILNKDVFQVVSAIVNDTAILHLQNGVILHPTIHHTQANFHRDLTFLNFTSNKPFSISVFWAIDDFDKTSGGTWIVPSTHKISDWPSDEYLQNNAIQINADAGSVLIFDSMLIHKGGENKGNKKRRAVNHMYTRPFIKQQIDFPTLMKGRFDMESKISQVLGFWSIPPKNVEEYRADPDKRTYRRGQ